MWNKLTFFLFLVLLFLPNLAFGGDRVLITYKEEYLVKDMNLVKMINSFIMHFDFPIDRIKFKNLKLDDLKNYRYIFIPSMGDIPNNIKTELYKLNNSKICFIGKVSNLDKIKYSDEEKGFTKAIYKNKAYFISPKNLIYIYKKDDTGTTLATITDGIHEKPLLIKQKNINLI